MREVISLHLGQAGVQLGTTCWELYCLEHGLDPSGKPSSQSPEGDGKRPGSGVFSSGSASTSKEHIGDFSRGTNNKYSEGFTSFFQEMSHGNFSPLAMLIDLEPSVVDTIKTGKYRKLYAPLNMITGNEDAANNFARGACSVGKKMLDPMTMDPLRKMAETCDRLQGFMLYHSFGGGTGSGFNAILNEALSAEFPKRSKLEVSIFPSPTMSTAVVEPYNAVLNTHATLDHTDCVFLSDNEAMYRICQTCLDIDSPSYENLNYLLALNVSSITSSLRFQGSLNADFTDFQTNLVPYPKIHFPVMSYAPIVSSRKATHETMGIADLTGQCFSPNNRLLRCDNEAGLYMSCCLLYRGDVVPRDVNDALSHMKVKRSVRFVPWSPTGFKVGINAHTPMTLNEGQFTPINRSVCMLCNTTAIKESWMNVNQKYGVMVEKQAFIHWYIAEGLERDQFLQALDSLLTLEQDYDFMATEME